MQAVVQSVYYITELQCWAFYIQTSSQYCYGKGTFVIGETIRYSRTAALHNPRGTIPMMHRDWPCFREAKNHVQMVKLE